MRKADKIRELHKMGLKTSEIVKEVADTTIGYVGVVVSDLRVNAIAGNRLRHDQLVYRKTHKERRNSDRKKNYDIGRKHALNQHAIWSLEDEDLVLTFMGTDRELASKIKRSVRAIQGKRNKLNKFKNKE